MVVPQIRNTALALLLIMIGLPLTVGFGMYQAGELQTWPSIMTFLQHMEIPTFWACVGWICFKSPFAGKLTDVLQNVQKPDGTTVQTSVKITEPSDKPGE